MFNALERTTRRLLDTIATSSVPIGAVGFQPEIASGASVSVPMRPAADTEVAHYVILGFGDFGQTLALQLAELAHFENNKRLRLTIVDHDIESKARSFLARHPRFGPAYGAIPAWDFQPAGDEWSCDAYVSLPAASLQNGSLGIRYACNAQYLNYVDACDDEFLLGMSRAFKQPYVKPAILVCFEEDRKNFAIAQRMKSKLNTFGDTWTIFVWIPKQREFSHLLAARRGDPAEPSLAIPAREGLIPFGQCDGSASYQEVTGGWVEWLAKMIHLIWLEPLCTEKNHVETIHKFKMAVKSTNPHRGFAGLDWERLTKAASIEWDLIPVSDDWGQSSNRSAAIHGAVKAATMKRRIIKFTLRPIANSPQDENRRKSLMTPELRERLLKMEHNRWVGERLVNGWRYDNSKARDDLRKTRWQITPWEYLDRTKHGLEPRLDDDKRPIDERKNDELIVALLDGLIESGILVTQEV